MLTALLRFYFLISCIATKDPSGMPYVIIFFVLAIIGELTDAVSRLLISKSKKLDKITEKLDIEWIYLDDTSEDKND